MTGPDCTPAPFSNRMELNPDVPLTALDWHVALRLIVASLVGLALGIDRELKGNAAGLRTHGLLCLGGALATVIGLSLYYQLGGEDSRMDVLRVLQALATAIGIIAAGAVFIRGGTARNMTSAAHIWLTTIVGVACGAGLYPVVLVVTVLALGMLTVLQLVERRLFGESKPSDDMDQGK